MIRTKPLILVIEDDNTLRDVIVRCLIPTYDVISASNGADGVQLAKFHLPDLVVCDIAMPELDGYGVLDRLHHNDATAMTPFIFLTARQEYEDIRQGMNLGADDYLTKPFALSDLRQSVATRLQKAHVQQTRSQKRLEELRENITRALPHELRTPLAMIYGYVHLLLDEADEHSAEQQQFLETIQSYTERLHQLIEKFLAYSHTETMLAQGVGIHREVLDHPEQVIGAVAAERAQQHQRSADVHVSVKPARLHISPDHLRKTVDELLDNALKFSQPGTPVYIIGVEQDGVYSLSLIDRGRGLSSDQIEAIGAYMQFDRDKYEQPGLGLGLITVKRLVEAYGGQISIDSAPGRQTIVSVLLPAGLRA